MNASDDPELRTAALAVLTARRYPFDQVDLTVECGQCGATGRYPLTTETTAVGVRELVAGLRHDARDRGIDLAAWCAGDRGRGLRLAAPDGPGQGRLEEPADDRRWADARGMELLGLVERRLAGDPGTPVALLRLDEPGDDSGGAAARTQASGTIHGAFHRQAGRTPDAPAVLMSDGEVSYRSLADRATAVAAALSRYAPGPVAMDLEPGADEAAVLLGVLAAGRSYLPIDRRSPQSRLARIVELVRPAVTIADRPPGLSVPALSVRELIDGEADPATPVDWTAGDPTQPAYIMFTSGSTGTPKGVVVAHESVLRLAASGILPTAAKRGRFLRAAPLAFDASTFELWLPLLHGGAVVPVDGPIADPELLAGRLRAPGADVAWFTAGLFHQLCTVDPAVFAPLRWLFVGGDVVQPEAVAKVLSGTRLHVVNGYGPTENTTFTATYVVDSAEQATARRRLPIGYPVGDDVLLVLDPAGNPVPQGLSGELTVAGRGVALGYVPAPNDPAEGPFGSIEHRGERLRSYRTGDHVAVLADGSLDFLGRVDGQVKHRGFRVELAEIEAELARVPGVRQAAAVLDRSGADADPRLQAVAVLDSRQPADVADIREHLRTSLPQYMVPDRILVIDEIPLGRTGKVDRRRIAELLRSTADQAVAGEDPVRDAVERVLGHRDFDDDDNLLQHGLHSLRAFRLLRELRVLTATIGIQHVLSAPSVASLRSAVREGSS
jgi:amino acid adenylation domain-containing protein